MLRALSGKRAEIARAMEFAMNRAEAADEVSEKLKLALMERLPMCYVGA